MSVSHTSYRSALDTAPTIPLTRRPGRYARVAEPPKDSRSRKQKDWRAMPAPCWLARYDDQWWRPGSPDNYPGAANGLLHLQTFQRMTMFYARASGEK